MIQRLIAIKILAAVLLLNGCAGIRPGNDPFVVNAEKSTTVAVEAVNTFLKFEYDNQALVKSKAPVIHNYAYYLRANAPLLISDATTLITTYKNNRTPANKANLQTALAVLSKVVSQITQYTSQIKGL